MADLGKMNSLRVLRIARQGLYLDGENLGDILLPNQYVKAGTGVDSVVDVFVTCDSEDRFIAMTRTPFACVGEFATLQVVSVDPQMGAFLDWGLNKDLFLPIREQAHRVRRGDWVVVYILVDERSNRIIASTRLNRFLSREEPTYRKGEKVNLLIIGETELGYEAIVEGAHKGLLYHTDMRISLFYGQKTEGFVRLVREDGKIDLALDPAGYSRVRPLAERIIDELKAKGGRLPFDDSSTPEEIRSAFSASKKAFKQAIGALYKERRIVMLEHGISLPIDPPDVLPQQEHRNDRRK